MVERTIIDSTIETTSTAAMHDPKSTQEQEIEWLEPDAIELLQRHAKLEGKREYEASRDDGISYYSGGAEDRFYPGGVMKLNICTPMHRSTLDLVSIMQSWKSVSRFLAVSNRKRTELKIWRSIVSQAFVCWEIERIQS